jgi:hypothetical protein
MTSTHGSRRRRAFAAPAGETVRHQHRRNGGLGVRQTVDQHSGYSLRRAHPGNDQRGDHCRLDDADSARRRAEAPGTDPSAPYQQQRCHGTAALTALIARTRHNASATQFSNAHMKPEPANGTAKAIALAR